MTKLIFKNKNSNYDIIVDQNSIKVLGKEIKKVCPETKKIALIYDERIPIKLISKIKK